MGVHTLTPTFGARMSAVIVPRYTWVNVNGCVCSHTVCGLWCLLPEYAEWHPYCYERSDASLWISPIEGGLVFVRTCGRGIKDPRRQRTPVLLPSVREEERQVPSRTRPGPNEPYVWSFPCTSAVLSRAFVFAFMA